MMRWVAGAALVLVGACADQAMTYRELEAMANRHQSETLSRPPDTCQMAQHQDLIGMDGAAIDRASLPADTRVICHECQVTMDYRAERLNVELGPDGTVVRLHCG